METLRDWFSNSDVVKVTLAILGLIVITILVRIIRRTMTRYITDTSMRYRARKAVTFIGYFFSLLLLVVIFQTRLAGLALFLSVAAAGVAIALQEVILSVAGWLAISFGGFYNVGDRVQLGNTKGDVIDISILRTTVMEIDEWVASDLYTGRIVRIANSFVFRAPVYNFSGDFPFVWDEITVPVKYGSDFHRAREILQQIVEEVTHEFSEHAQEDWNTMLRKYRVENATIHPLVTLIANDNWIEFTVRYIVDYKRRRVIKDRLFTRILDAFAQTSGEIRFASTTLQVVGVPELTVRSVQQQPPPSPPL